jgi:dihydropteroate synthase
MAPAVVPAGPARTVVMGICNVTPDSFSDGGRFLDAGAAVAHGLALAAQGADIVDVGGESTRPGAGRITVDEELGRVVPVVRSLADAGVRVSIDTMRAAVARAAVVEGAAVINDVSGGRADSAMLPAMAELGVDCVLMHWRAHSVEMARFAVYDDVVAEVCRELAAARDAAVAAGVAPDRIVLDPGLGFAKDAGHNWALLRRLDALTELGHRVLIGASRKRFLGSLLRSADGVDRAVDGRDAATAAVTALAARAGVWGVRVHDARASADAVAVAAALAGATPATWDASSLNQGPTQGRR